MAHKLSFLKFCFYSGLRLSQLIWLRRARGWYLFRERTLTCKRETNTSVTDRQTYTCTCSFMYIDVLEIQELLLLYLKSVWNPSYFEIQMSCRQPLVVFKTFLRKTFLDLLNFPQFTFLQVHLISSWNLCYNKLS